MLRRISFRREKTPGMPAQSGMMTMPLTVSSILRHAETVHGQSGIVSRLPEGASGVTTMHKQPPARASSPMR